MNTKLKNKLQEPFLIEGGISIDDRGEVGFVNDFDMHSIRRFYTVRNHKSGFIRAWHAHKKENKIVIVIEGAAIIAAVGIDNWEKPSKNLDIHRYILSEKKPTALYIPCGHANGFMTLTENTKLIFFSTALLEESLGDDFRYDADYWNPWIIMER